MEEKILLNKYRYADSEEKNMSSRINLSNEIKSVREDDYSERVNEYDLYLDEREACNTIRLTTQINLVATNHLFNFVTEITKNEDDCKNRECLNFNPKAIGGVYGKGDSYKWGSSISDCIQDTQITYGNDSRKNYTYNCGIDIFDNHVLRSKTKIPNYYKKQGVKFNTITDLLCDIESTTYPGGTEKTMKLFSPSMSMHDNGIVATPNGDNSKYLSNINGVGVVDVKDRNTMHLYSKNGILSFADCLQSRVVEKNGWVGFLNRSKIESYDYSNNINLGISRVINNRDANSFIELYPDSSCYSIMPYYNRIMNRMEKNWEYCLTYPCSSTRKGIPCIDEKLGTLKIAFIDESENDDDDLQKTVIYSTCKHGLKNGDLVNIYRSKEDGSKTSVVGENVVVDTVIDDYSFSVYMDENICDRWVSVFDWDRLVEIFGEGNFDTKKNIFNYGEKKYVESFNNYVNADFDTESTIGSQNLSFAKTVDGNQCEYYVRIFSRFPNFDFMDGEINETTIYGEIPDGNGKRYIDEYSKMEYEKQSTMTRLSFAKNIYGDDMAQIVFNDDIDISNIKDNLGRPLTSLYLSFFKTNYGRKDWYNKNLSASTIEHSHCFGKLNCGLDLNPMATHEKYRAGNTRVMNNVEGGCSGLTQIALGRTDDEIIYSGLTQSVSGKSDDDEIIYSGQTMFYGDLCEYCDVLCNEKVLQPIKHRFNTQQRELRGSRLSGARMFHGVKYHDIEYDDYSPDGSFYLSEDIFDDDPIGKMNGYCYVSNYEIPIRSFSGKLSENKPIQYMLDSINDNGDGTYTITTSSENYINLDDAISLYDIPKRKEIQCNVINILATNILKVSLDSDTVADVGNPSSYRLYKREGDVPSYARISSDGSGLYRWREVVQNGFEDVDGIVEEYPFANGCLYVNKRIDIFLREQDPFGENGIGDILGVGPLGGKESPIETDFGNSNSDDSINEKNSKC